MALQLGRTESYPSDLKMQISVVLAKQVARCVFFVVQCSTSGTDAVTKGE